MDSWHQENPRLGSFGASCEARHCVATSDGPQPDVRPALLDEFGEHQASPPCGEPTKQRAPALGA